MSTWENISKQIRPIYVLSFLFFVITLWNLTILPIFNDEAIYLDWGWANTHIPGHLYDSLFDAKPPLMMWLFGWIGNLFPDPLYGGRFISVLFGYGSMLGIYTLTKKIFDARTAFLAGIFYTITPIFFFYNRQALLEAGVMCASIWSGVILWDLFQKYSHSKSIYLGMILGMGFFIKASMLLFIISAGIVLLVQFIRTKKIHYLVSIVLAAAAFFCVDFLLFINPLFWGHFQSNVRYTFSFADLLKFPVSTWLGSWRGFFDIGFFFITPLLFVASFVGGYMVLRKKDKNYLLLLTFFTLALLAEIFTIRSEIQRYLVSFLPFLVMLAAFAFAPLLKASSIKKSVIVLALIPAIYMISLLIFSPREYFLQLAKISAYSEMPYAGGQTSGYGVNEAVEYIKQHTPAQELGLVLYGLQPGTPENAINLSIEKTPNLIGMHFDASLFNGLDKTDCMTSEYPVFVVTRMDQKLGMDKYLVLEKKFSNPDPAYWISIYSLKKDCKGTAGSLSDAYADTITLMRNIKYGIN